MLSEKLNDNKSLIILIQKSPNYFVKNSGELFEKSIQHFGGTQ